MEFRCWIFSLGELVGDWIYQEVSIGSLRMAMLDAAKLKEVKGEVTILEDVTESDDPTVLAKQQLKVMTSLHHGWSTYPPGPRTPPRNKGLIRPY